jgi:putative hydrolase of the HAD superfamily
MTPPTAWVFDVDDTLYLERDYVRSGFIALEPLVLARFGVAGFATVASQLFLEGRRGDTFNVALARLGVAFDDVDISELVEAYRTHMPTIALLPDAAELIANLRMRGTRIGVLTDGPVASQLAKVASLGLNELAEIVIATGQYGPGFGKPHPRGFREIAERSGCRSLTYVGDNPRKDFQAPHDLGWQTVRVRREGALHEYLESGPYAHRTLSRLQGLAEMHETEQEVVPPH